MPFYALIKGGKVLQQGKWDNPDHMPVDEHDEAAEITEELSRSPYPLIKNGAGVVVDPAAKAKMDTHAAKWDAIAQKIEDGIELTKKEEQWWSRFRYMRIHRNAK